MSHQNTLLSSVALITAATALGLSAFNTLNSERAPSGDNSQQVADLKTSMDARHQQLLDSFEQRVETSLESIIERRRAEQANAASADNTRPNANGTAYTPGPKADPVLSTNDEGQVVYGNPDAAISIITFEDFRCSFCKRYHGELQEYVDTSGGDVNWIYRPFPVLGQASVQLAHAGECTAMLEGPEAFWRYSNAAYATANWKSALSQSDLSDPDAVEACVGNRDAQDRIDASMADGRDLEVTGTPASVFRNNLTEEGAFVPGFLELNQIHQVVEGVRNE